MRLLQTLSMLIASYLLMGCVSLTKPSTVGPSPLVVASCPNKLPLLVDDTLGALVNNSVQVAGIYYGCIAAVGVK